MDKEVLKALRITIEFEDDEIDIFFEGLESSIPELFSDMIEEVSRLICSSLLLSGSSFAGGADPVQWTAISLGQITTTLLFSLEPNLDLVVFCEILNHYKSDTFEAFSNINTSLEESRDI